MCLLIAGLSHIPVLLRQFCLFWLLGHFGWSNDLAATSHYMNHSLPAKGWAILRDHEESTMSLGMPFSDSLAHPRSPSPRFHSRSAILKQLATYWEFKRSEVQEGLENALCFGRGKPYSVLVSYYKCWFIIFLNPALPGCIDFILYAALYIYKEQFILQHEQVVKAFSGLQHSQDAHLTKRIEDSALLVKNAACQSKRFKLVFRTFSLSIFFPIWRKCFSTVKKQREAGTCMYAQTTGPTELLV